MSESKAREYRVTKPFRDAGTGVTYSKDDPITVDRGTAQNYLAAGLIKQVRKKPDSTPVEN